MVNFIAVCFAPCSISLLVTLQQPVKIYKHVTLTRMYFYTLPRTRSRFAIVEEKISFQFKDFGR